MEMCILFPMVFYSLINSVYVCVDTCVYKYVGRCACTYVCIQVETKGQLWILFFRCWPHTSSSSILSLAWNSQTTLTPTCH